MLDPVDAAAKLHIDGEVVMTSTNRKNRFQLVPFNKLRPNTRPAYLVKGLIPRVGFTVIWGPPKSAKSFFVINLMLSVALGWKFHDRQVIQGAVVYCAFEGADGYGKRAEAFRRYHQLHTDLDVSFYLVAAPMSFSKDYKDLIASIRLALGTVKPVAVVLDTLNRSLDGSESSDEDMAKYVQAGDAVREAFNCAVIIVHHCGHDTSRPRGHTSLTGAVDAQLAVRRDGANNITVKVEWMKDGPDGDGLMMALNEIEVGTDEDGNPITSCVLCPSEAKFPRRGQAASFLECPGRHTSHLGRFRKR